ncbi:MAG: universal stress protein [Firmicutes bacterium]|nr:universal stress protein [Bacillota bacterium]
MKKAKRILVGIKEASHAAELAELASRVAAKGATIWLVHVIELPAATPLDAPVPELEAAARKALAAAQRTVRRFRLKPAPLVLRARLAGQALLDELKEKKIDLAVLGYHHKRTLGELLFGTTHDSLARSAPCHLLMSIPPRR